MVDALYVRLEATAKRLIAKYGKDAFIVRDVLTGPPHNPTVTPTPYACKLADIGYSLTDRDATLILTGDKVGIISPDLSIVPEKSDRIRIDGEDYNLVDLEPLNPGGLTVIYEYHARR